MTVTNLDYTPETAVYDPEVDEYTFTFEIIGPSAFELWYIDATDGRTRASTDRYLVQFDGPDPIYDGGRVTLTKPAPEGTVTLSFERNTPITQTLDYNRYDAFPMKSIEFTLDKHMMICQELAYRKCDADVGDLEMTQLLSFDPYRPLLASDLNNQLQKTFDILAAIAASAEDCRGTPTTPSRLDET